ncbi:MAG: sugar ABC transporter permease [Armatimonadota bacterium]|nr:sugar ABC transporter permease [Armatimonadota bacterium]
MKQKTGFRSRRVRQDCLAALAFLAPNFLGFCVFVAFPVLFSLVMAFTNWDLTLHNELSRKPLEFVGLENFVQLAHDPKFSQYLYNTVFLMLGMPVAIGGSLLLAIVLSQKMRGIIAYRTMFYLPTITSGVALFILWKALFNPEFGPINTVLRSLFDALHLGWSPPKWLLDVSWAKPAIMIMGIWTAIGSNNMLLYLAGISNIPQELYEAADIDGAASWSKFRHVTWPQLAPTTFFIIVMSTIGGLQGGFEQARVMTNGGPAGSTTTLSYYIYLKGFEDFQLGYASAVAWTLFVMIFAMTLINWRFGNRAAE